MPLSLFGSKDNARNFRNWQYSPIAKDVPNTEQLIAVAPRGAQLLTHDEAEPQDGARPEQVGGHLSVRSTQRQARQSAHVRRRAFKRSGARGMRACARAHGAHAHDAQAHDAHGRAAHAPVGGGR